MGRDRCFPQTEQLSYKAAYICSALFMSTTQSIEFTSDGRAVAVPYSAGGAVKT